MIYGKKKNCFSFLFNLAENIVEEAEGGKLHFSYFASGDVFCP